jgi:tellurite resistance protein TerC
MPPQDIPAVAESGESWIFWAGFSLFVVLMLVLDLRVFHREAHEVKTKEALGWSIFWIALALAFNAAIVPWLGADKAKQFFAAYLLEKSLSVDNLFVFVVLFRYFAVPGELQHRVLFFGVLGAIVLRLIFILAGAALLAHFHWTALVFGAILILTGAKLMFANEAEQDPSKNFALRIATKWFRFTKEFDGQRLITVRDGLRYGTPLLLVLIVIEATDVVFAVDSVPACLAISDDPFIVFTSNIFAILGLRALYFLLARFLGSFHYLKHGLAVVLAFVGVKMVLQYFGTKIDINASLAVIAGVITIATVASLVRKPPADAAA